MGQATSTFCTFLYDSELGQARMTDGAGAGEGLLEGNGHRHGNDDRDPLFYFDDEIRNAFFRVPILPVRATMTQLLCVRSIMLCISETVGWRIKAGVRDHHT